MSQQMEKLAVLFADICGSTALYDSVGDVQARHLIAWCIATMVREIIPFQGCLVKTIGDEIMCTFSSANAAFQAACAMQNAVRNKRPDGSDITMHIRVGFHYGDVLQEAGDVFGDTVNVAARVAGLARTDQIMTTQAVHDALSATLQNQTHLIMSAELKGKQEKYPIFLVMWDKDNTQTTRLISPIQCQSMECIYELTLDYKDQHFKINDDNKSIMLGRGNNCDIIVNNSFVSRQHVKVEYRFDKFWIIDQSTNGTYIRFNDGNIAYITREEMILQGSGCFSLGQSNFEHSTELIQFSIDLSSRWTNNEL